MSRQPRHREPTIFEVESCHEDLYIKFDLPEKYIRSSAPLIPNLPESEVVRHFIRLSQMNYGIDNGFYPLGSCTMKYNPKVLVDIPNWDKIANIHPHQPESTVQGSLAMMHELEKMLCEIGGVDAVTLQPAAGAQGEYTGLAIVHAYHEANNDAGRDQVILPDTAHGTNPASAAMARYEVVEVPSKEGMIDLDALKAALSDRTAAFMLTNPNTLGIFERDVVEIAGLVHEAGSLLYYDGANFNAIMGITSPGRMGFDIVHFNLHKTFGTPHGGGGPGAGPIGVKKRLERFLPVPRIARNGDLFSLNYEHPDSIGKVLSFYGNYGVLVQAYIYIKMLGSDGLKAASERAVLNSNYLKKKITRHLPVPYDGLRMHEFVASAERLKQEKGVSALLIAKRLLDYGFHAPTAYFPLLVPEALMIEPTETEMKLTMDAFADAIGRIVKEDPEVLAHAPYEMAVARVDEVTASRRPVLTWKMAGIGNEGQG